MHSYEEVIDYLYGQLPVFSVSGAGAYKPGLDNALALSELFDNPHRSFPVVHIAGTNGKGSTSNMLASVLQEAGMKVGLYTSPHIFDFRERIRINGEKISEDNVVEFVERYISMPPVCSPSFFELTTIMAFDYFKENNVDIAVIETGLGGRLDTTNIVSSILSIITNVSIDHTAQLGESISLIAAEKAGIIKKGVPVVIGYASEEERKVFDIVAKRNHSQIIYACDIPRIIPQGDTYKWKKSDAAPEIGLHCDLKGDFQQQNINTVLHAIEQMNEIGVRIDEEHILKGLSHVCENTHLFGRWSTLMRNGVKIVVDTGHNIGAWQWLAPRLSEISNKGNLHIVLGFVSDKQIEPIFKMLPEKAVYHLVAPTVKRARRVEDLMALADRYHLKYHNYDSVSEGCSVAFDMCESGDTLFIGGSNYLVAEIKDFLYM